jgi:hypothetical protein
LLQKQTSAAETGELQNQIKAKLLMGQTDNAKKLEEQAKADASKLLEVLAGPDYQQLRDQHRFTLESLQKEKNIKLEDCDALYKYAKILYE